MNKWLLTASLLFLSVAGFSQVSIGAQLGAVNSNPSYKYNVTTQKFETEGKWSWQAGLMADIPLGEGGFRFMPELKYVNKGFNTNINTTIPILNQQVPLVVTGGTNLSYLELPVNFAYAADLGSGKLIIGAGPYVGYGLGIKDDVKAVVNGQEVTIREVEYGTDIKRFDYGANAMLGYLLNGGLMLKANYSLGLADISNQGDGTEYKNRYFGISVVYFFKRAGE